MTPDLPAREPVVTDRAETHDDEIRTLVTRLSRPHRSGGRVIERAAVLAEGADFDAVMVWIEAHGGTPEVAKPPKAARGLHAPRQSAQVADPVPLRFVLPAGALR
ncbi:MAG: hypothetical protein ACSLFR_01980 [Solirubrobacteraceae bacterium]